MTDGVQQDKKENIIYLILEQQYTELIQQGRSLEAVGLLQNRLVPICPDKQKMFKLAQMIMCLPQSASPGQNGTPANRSELEQNTISQSEIIKQR